VTKSWWDELLDFLAGLWAQPAGAPAEASAGVAVPICATGYDRDAEEAGKRVAIVAFCEEQLGKPYLFGTECDPAGPACDTWDCSELTENAYDRAGVRLPDGSGAQRAFCRRVLEPKAGDLGFLDPNAHGVGHVELYDGAGSTIGAEGVKAKAVRRIPRTWIETHPRFAGWYRHPNFALPLEERA